jgi:hypothetical protein
MKIFYDTGFLEDGKTILVDARHNLLMAKYLDLVT